MERHTEKGRVYDDPAMAKLQTLEDLEESLGCDLIELLGTLMSERG